MAKKLVRLTQSYQSWLGEGKITLSSAGKSDYKDSIIFDSTTGIIYQNDIAYGSDTSDFDAIKTLLSGTTLVAALTDAEGNNVSGLTVTPSQGADGLYTYALSANPDNTSIKIVDGQLTSGLSLSYNSEEKKIQLKAGSSVLGEVSSSDIIGTGIVTSTTYNKEDNSLTLTFADGSDVSVTLTSLIDVDDILIEENSQKYLELDSTELEKGNASFKIKTQAVSEATSTSTGLVDAKDAKDYIDGKLKAVTADGDTYITASVDNATNVLSVEANIESLAISDGSISAESGKLLDSSNTATVITNYVIGKINDLDQTVQDDDTTPLITVSQVDGKLDSVSLAKAAYSTTSSQFTGSGVVDNSTLTSVINDIWDWEEH